MEQKPRITAGDNLGWLFGALLIVLGLVALANQIFPFNFGGLIWAALFIGGGAAFYLLKLRNPASWWALIPAYTLAAIGVLILLGTINFPGDLIGIFVMLAIAFPFLYVYLHNRRNWWALIPAYTMTAIAGIIALSAVFPEGQGSIVPTYVMLAIALPFYYVFLRDRRKWWALIPAGIMTLVGLGIFMANFQYVLPIALIILGGFLLARQIRGQVSPPVQPPKTGPEADKPPSA